MWLRGVEGISFVQFDEKDVVRHTLVQRIVKAYERYNVQVGAGRQLTLKLGVIRGGGCRGAAAGCRESLRRPDGSPCPPQMAVR